MKIFRYHFSDYLWLYLVAVFAWLIIFGFYWLLSKKAAGNHLPYFLMVAIAFSFLGLTIGIHIGLSVSPVVGIIIPSLLTFIGGFVIYVFVFTDKSKLQDGFVLLIILTSLCFFLMLGSDYACSVRNDYEAKLQNYLYNQKKDFEYFKSELAKGNVRMEGEADSLKRHTAHPAPDSLDKKIFDQILKEKQSKQH
jgi:glucan phosphoethanolaminetransferase (alkaline phosphatase superfamily)